MTCGFKGCPQPLRATGEKDTGWCPAHGDRYLLEPMGYPEPRRRDDRAGLYDKKKAVMRSAGPSRKESGRL